MKQSVIRIEYGEKKARSERFFVAKAIIEGKTKATKTFSIGGRRDENEAFKLAHKAANDLSKKYNLETVNTSIQEVKERYKPLKDGKNATKQPAQNQSISVAADSLIDKFGHTLRFKAMIRYAIKTHGLEKIIEILESGLEMSKEILEEQKKSERAVREANLKIAQVILETRKSGIEMEAPNEDIERAIEELMIKNRSSSRLNSMAGEYEYKGEKWNGTGVMPASFSAYLNENDSHNIEDLLKSNQAKLRQVSN